VNGPRNVAGCDAGWGEADVNWVAVNFYVVQVILALPLTNGGGPWAGRGAEIPQPS
jgi:hypothetical protein